MPVFEIAVNGVPVGLIRGKALSSEESLPVRGVGLAAAIAGRLGVSFALRHGDSAGQWSIIDASYSADINLRTLSEKDVVSIRVLEK